jgi:hypothetical protein
MTDPPEPLDLDLLREAAEAGFHATPPTVLALLDLLDRQAVLLVRAAAEGFDLSDDPPPLHLVPDPEPDPEVLPWHQLPLPLEDDP